MASQDWFEKDFYAVLGVASDADANAIKKAYRKLAREYHPDSKPGDAAAEKRFKEIGEAYAVLSDAEQRKQYDAIRAMRSGGPRFTAGGPGGGGNAGFEDIFSNLFGQGGAQGDPRFGTPGGQPGGRAYAGEAPDLEDLLSMFGQQAGHGGAGGGFAGTRDRAGSYGGARRAPRKGRDVHATATMSFRQAVMGDTVRVNGVGGKPITARIPSGVKDGATIRLAGKGEPAMTAGAPAGDLLLKISVNPHSVFTRDGDNLVVDLPVTFAEAALGATVAVPTLDGTNVKVKIAPGTPSGRTLRVKGRGVPKKDGAGDLLARVLVQVPQRLDEASKAAVETLQRADAGHDPRAEVFRKARSD
ncbi:molecular chaperone DnaJ [Kineosphaera limosa]|uniref:Heat shock protein DnaJ family protein n=1 Tax=Kineosphaera limosa NBRC 100340 TaxID=1184609 RepID=K6WS29_9MICO|nr:DnaJ C-terminal domain-containing protein [Kineosphaera limosa]NYD99961.1 molecular chaperone DnaJ [Kineosphaera limosa]GAB96656.1 heat shock protein DnaJ family protein [Kineosphaera limosa NBRC 100340]